jgi:DNA-directed RNA polymerase specialized sigma24 family protein
MVTSADAAAKGEDLLAGRDCADEVIENLVIRKTLLKIDPDQRACLLLHFWEGLKYREIAGVIGIRRGSQEKGGQRLPGV